MGKMKNRVCLLVLNVFLNSGQDLSLTTTRKIEPLRSQTYFLFNINYKDTVHKGLMMIKTKGL